MAQRGMTDVIELRDDALPHLKGNSPERKPEPLYQPTKRQDRFFTDAVEFARRRAFASPAARRRSDRVAASPHVSYGSEAAVRAISFRVRFDTNTGHTRRFPALRLMTQSRP
jgi:hypothetical protein